MVDPPPGGRSSIWKRQSRPKPAACRRLTMVPFCRTRRGAAPASRRPLATIRARRRDGETPPPERPVERPSTRPQHAVSQWPRISSSGQSTGASTLGQACFDQGDRGPLQRPIRVVAADPTRTRPSPCAPRRSRPRRRFLARVHLDLAAGGQAMGPDGVDCAARAPTSRCARRGAPPPPSGQPRSRRAGCGAEIDHPRHAEIQAGLAACSWRR